MGKVEGTIWLFTAYCRTPAYPWVEGTLEETLPDRSYVGESYGFQAKVYDKGSKFGINKGRISKLFVWKNDLGRRDSDRNIIANYDRGWDVQPKNAAEKEALQQIISGLEETPKQ